MSYEKELKVALEAVQKASVLCSSVQFNLIENDTVEKNDRSPVTIADFGSQAVISFLLEKSLPHDFLVGEEDIQILQDGADLRHKVYSLVKTQLPHINEKEMMHAIDRGNSEPDYKGRYWTVDPIDGTKGFLRKEQYAIALALVEDGELKLGILGCPNLPIDFLHPEKGTGCLFYALKDQGAFMCDLAGDNKKNIQVDNNTDFRQSRFVESVESAHSAHSVHDRISKALGMQKEALRIDSQCKYAAVARGDVSIYLRYPKDDKYREKIWDHAAGALVVQEAGGKVTDINGKSLDFSLGRKLLYNRGVVVTNKHYHDKIIETISNL